MISYLATYKVKSLVFLFFRNTDNRITDILYTGYSYILRYGRMDELLHHVVHLLSYCYSGSLSDRAFEGEPDVFDEEGKRRGKITKIPTYYAQ